MSITYEGEWENKYREGNGILRKSKEDFELQAKFRKYKIVEEFKVLIKNKEIKGIFSDENKLDIQIQNEEEKISVIDKFTSLLNNFEDEF